MAETDIRRPVTTDSCVQLQNKASDISGRWMCPGKGLYPWTSFSSCQCHFNIVSHLSSRKGKEDEDWKHSNKATLFRTPDNTERQVHSLFFYSLKHESQRTSRNFSISYTNGIVRLEKAGYFPQLSRPRWPWGPQNGTSGSFSCSKEHEANHSSSIEMCKRSNRKAHYITGSRYFPEIWAQQYSVPHNLVNEIPDQFRSISQTNRMAKLWMKCNAETSIKHWSNSGDVLVETARN
jgi:hypothetical protein